MTPRPCKCRRVEFEPRFTYFKPAGVPLFELEELTLTVEELEALRLKDLEELDQEEAAERMNVSRPTFARILTHARTKVTSALVAGKAIKIEGGNFELSVRNFECSDCGYRWEVGFGTGMRGQDMNCPKCQGENVSRKGQEIIDSSIMRGDE